MGKAGSAVRAVEKMDGLELNGRRLKVSLVSETQVKPSETSAEDKALEDEIKQYHQRAQKQRDDARRREKQQEKNGIFLRPNATSAYRSANSGAASAPAVGGRMQAPRLTARP